MSARGDALVIARAAVAAIDLESRVRDALAGEAGAPTVVAIGKAAPAMARGALAACPNAARVRVVTTDGTDANGLAHRDLMLLRAAHPVPDARSVAAAERLLEDVAGCELLVALVSGGASSVACAPSPGLSLDDKRAVVSALLASGAPIAEVNLVRRHLSRFKGGGLARAALPARTRTLVVSDVLGGSAIDVGSGPATPDPTTIDDARRALERWAGEHVARVSPFLVTPFPASLPESARVESEIVASPSDLAAAALDAARAQGFEAQALPATDADALEVGAMYAALARALPRGACWVRVAEPSVRLPKHAGRGGRAGRVALAAWAHGLPSDVALACVASDGVDGSSGAAGAVVRGTAPSGAREALDAFDDAPFLARHGASIAGAASGINLLDVHVLVRAH